MNASADWLTNSKKGQTASQRARKTRHDGLMNGQTGPNRPSGAECSHEPLHAQAHRSIHPSRVSKGVPYNKRLSLPQMRRRIPSLRTYDAQTKGEKENGVRLPVWMCGCVWWLCWAGLTSSLWHEHPWWRPQCLLGHHPEHQLKQPHRTHRIWQGNRNDQPHTTQTQTDRQTDACVSISPSTVPVLPQGRPGLQMVFLRSSFSPHCGSHSLMKVWQVSRAS